MSPTASVDYFIEKCEAVKADARGRKQYRLRAGDLIPDWPPRHRYQQLNGYVRLVWNVAPKFTIIAAEHRVVAGLPAVDVHHRNKNKADNDPANLEPLSKIDHARMHHPSAYWNISEGARLYADGLSLRQLASRFGVGYASVKERLKKHNIPLRSRLEGLRLHPGSACFSATRSQGTPASFSTGVATVRIVTGRR